ncbi:MAG: GGDEF domain-containing protein [Gemmatimonadaceae bacterium]|nr:GGDEF domain-containing protein [Gemmatimonadaceae bacterium]
MGVTIGRKLSLLFVVALALLVGAGLLSYANTRELAATTASLNDGRRVAAQIARAVQALSSAERGGAAWVARADTTLRGQAYENIAIAETAARQLSDYAKDWGELRRLVASIDSSAAALHQIAGTPTSTASEALIVASPRVRATLSLADEVLAHHDRDLTARASHAAGAARSGDLLLRIALGVLLVLAPVAYLTMHRELSSHRAAEDALVQSEAQFRAATDGSLDAFYVLRALHDARGEVLDFEFVDVNRRAETLLGKRRDEVVGQRLCELIPSNRVNGFLDKYVSVMTHGTVLEEEFEVTTPDVRAAWIHHQVVPLRDGVAITSRDVTDRKQQEEALRALSLIDELTGLYNRRGFLTLAQQQLKLARRGHRELLLLFVDMDDFKEINDTFGHAEGDEALRRTASILRKTFRDSDIIARLGGDEFVVLAADIVHGTEDVIVQRLRSELRERNDRDGFPYRLSFSVGLASFDPARPPSIEDLLSTADAMLYEQKKHKGLPAGLIA